MNHQTHRRLELLESKGRKERMHAQRGNVESNINITPLVDVCLVLLIIFMVVTPLLNQGLELPLAWSPEKVSDGNQDLHVSVNEKGEYFIEDEKVAKADLLKNLTAELKKNPFRSVYFAADKSLQFGTLRPIFEMFRDVGVSNVGLMSKPNQEKVGGP